MTFKTSETTGNRYNSPSKNGKDSLKRGSASILRDKGSRIMNNGLDLDSSLTGSELAGGITSPKRRRIVWRDKTDLDNMASKGKDIDLSKLTAAEA